MPTMSTHQGRKLALVFIVLCFAAGTALNLRLRHLRESEAFYRWLLAAATNERLFQESSEMDRDADLFTLSVEQAKQFPPFRPFLTEGGDTEGSISVLGRIVADMKEDELVWQFACSDQAAQARSDFLNYAREQKLRFAQDIQYAEAQAQGVNIFNMFFGFRKVAANLIWLEVDRYWHQGNMYRMITLMHTCVALDPHFIEAYLIGAWHLAYNATARMMETPWPQREWHPRHKACVGEKERFYYYAVDFLVDGIRNNPRNYKLYFDLGYSIYKQKLNDYANAVKYLSEANRLPHDLFVPRQLFLCLELNGQYEEALAGWEDFVRRYPTNTISTDVAPRFIKRNQGLIYEQRYEELQRRAQQETDPAKAEQFVAEAEEYLQRAKEIWEILDDPYAEGKRLKMQALELRKQKRYLEAVALLGKARWESSQLWQDLSKLLIQIKKEGGIPLTVSERKALLRDSEYGLCAGMPEEERERRIEEREKTEKSFL